MYVNKSAQKNFYSLDKALAQSARFYFICLDLQGNYTYANSYFSDNYIPEKQHIQGVNFDKDLHPKDVDMFQEILIASILYLEKILPLKLRKKNLDGDFHTINWEFSGISNEKNDVIGVQCIGYDDTETYQSKLELEQLRKSSVKLSSIMLSCNDTYVFLDTNMHVVSFNQPAREKIKKIFGKELQIDANFLEFNQDKASFIESFGYALNGESRHCEHQVVFLTGEIAWFERYYYPAYDKHKQIIGVVFTSVDITQRKRAEQEIIRQNEQLKEISALQSYLVRRPIVNLLGILDLFAKEELSEENNALIQVLQQNILNLDSVISNVIEKTNDNTHVLAASSERNFVLNRPLQLAS